KRMHLHYKRKFICTSLFLLVNIFGFKANAQQSVFGRITTTDSLDLSTAVISAYRTNSSIMIKSGLVANTGKYLLDIHSTGWHYLTISIPGFKEYATDSFLMDSLKNSKVEKNIVIPRLDSIKNTSVEIVVALPFVQKKIDKLVVNPDALLTNTGLTVLEILEKSPGIMVDVNGNISLNGKSGVLVMIDGKPTYLSSADLATYLKTIPSAQIATMEIYSNPPAKFDASGSAGIINIIFKKNIDQGFNTAVSCSYGQGRYSRNNNALIFNFRHKKINLYSNLSYSNNGNYQDLTITRRYFNSSGSLASAFDQNNYIKKRDKGVNTKIGLDYYANKKSTFGLVLTGFENRNLHNSRNGSVISDELLEPITKVLSLNPSVKQMQNYSASANYAYSIDTTGKELITNFDFLNFNSNQTQSLQTKMLDAVGNPISNSTLNSDLPSTIKITTFKTDYTNPLKKKANWNTGYKYSNVTTTNNALFSNVDGSGASINNDTFSNKFNYTEKIHAGYFNLTKQWSKLTLQTGIRLEDALIKGIQFGNSYHHDSSIYRRFTNLFPTVYMMYNLDTTGNHVFNTSFGRRIERPDYKDLNPFTYPMDKFTLYSGNPFLQPTFSNNFEISYTYKNRITTSIVGGYFKNVVQETIEQKPGFFYSRPGNIGKQFTYGISINAMLPIKKWWNINCYTELMYNDFVANLYNQNLHNQGTYWYFSPASQITIKKKWNTELTFTYQSKVSVAQFVTIPFWHIRAGVGRKILNNYGSIKLQISDVFYSQQLGGEILAIGQSTASWYSYLDTRVITLAFSYKFNKGENLTPRNITGAEEEKQRVI
ncbi:MAG: TonB-dependent receptor, partial [Bacteroidia bacterium]|nr:TonB-dependent receptor [Bacteroidia bacterium]